MIESIDIVLYTSIFVLPGFIIKSIVDRLNPTKINNETVYVLSCLSYSIINLAIWSWLYNILLINKNKLDVFYWLLLVLVTLLGAVLIAVIIGVIRQCGIVGRIFDKVKIKHIGSSPTAWDRFFSSQQSSWVIVTLTDNSKIYGKYSTKSYSSSDCNERDIYIEKVYEINDNMEWIDDEKSMGILILKENIKTIEFLL